MPDRDRWDVPLAPMVQKHVSGMYLVWQELEPGHRAMAYIRLRRRRVPHFIARPLAYWVPRDWLPSMDDLYQEMQSLGKR